MQDALQEGAAVMTALQGTSAAPADADALENLAQEKARIKAVAKELARALGHLQNVTEQRNIELATDLKRKLSYWRKALRGPLSKAPDDMAWCRVRVARRRSAAGSGATP